MTNEEAIETIKTAIAEVEWEYPMNYAAAFDMAIEALKKQSKWIPVSERLPEDHDWYLITVKEKYTGYIYIPRVASHLHGNYWMLVDADTAPEGWINNLECIAWTLLPLPYEKENE